MGSFLAGNRVSAFRVSYKRELSPRKQKRLGILAAFGLAAALGAPSYAQTVTIAALGDSLTQGYGLVQGQGFVPQLEAWLRREGADVVLLNAGVSGDTTAGGLARLGWTLSGEVDGVIVALGGNDILRGIDPANSKSNLAAILTETNRRALPVLLIGQSAPSNFGPAYKADFDALYPALADQFNVLFYRDFLASLRQKDASAIPGFLQADNLHPNPKGVQRIVDDMGPIVLKLIAKIRTP